MAMSSVGTVGLLYVPVLHRGYVNWIERAAHRVEKIVILDESWWQLDETLRKDIRSLKPELVVSLLQAQFPQLKIELGTETYLKNLASNVTKWYVADDQVTRAFVAELAIPADSIQWDQTFLRWDHQRSLAPHEPIAQVIQASGNQLDWLQQIRELSQHSSDWWRQVAAAIVKEDRIIFSAWNQHVPNELQPYFEGDARANFHKGEHIELSTAFHAEAAVVALAAKQGISLQGASLFVTTFPCPYCAKVVAYSGISAVYYLDGYAVLDGESILKSQHVEIHKLVV